MGARKAAVALSFAIAGGIGTGVATHEAIQLDREAAQIKACVDAQPGSEWDRSDFCQEVPRTQAEVNVLNKNAEFYQLLGAVGVGVSILSIIVAVETFDKRDGYIYSHQTIHHTYDGPPEPPSPAGQPVA